MTARALGLAIAAVLASVGAASMAGGNTSGITTRQLPAPASPTPTAMRPKTPTSPAISVARAYVLAARTWSADTYDRAWRRELELAAGAYRRALRAARPTDGQLATMRADGAASRAAILRVDSTVTGSRARVVVELDERTRSGGRVVEGVTRNEVRLVRSGRRWRVVGFTALPGEER